MGGEEGGEGGFGWRERRGEDDADEDYRWIGGAGLRERDKGEVEHENRVSESGVRGLAEQDGEGGVHERVQGGNGGGGEVGEGAEGARGFCQRFGVDGKAFG